MLCSDKTAYTTRDRTFWCLGGAPASSAQMKRVPTHAALAPRDNPMASPRPSAIPPVWAKECVCVCMCIQTTYVWTKQIIIMNGTCALMKHNTPCTTSLSVWLRQEDSKRYLHYNTCSHHMYLLARQWRLFAPHCIHDLRESTQYSRSERAVWIAVVLLRESCMVIGTKTIQSMLSRPQGSTCSSESRRCGRPLRRPATHTKRSQSRPLPRRLAEDHGGSVTHE